MTRTRWRGAAAIAAALTVIVVAPLAAQGFKPRKLDCPPCLGIANSLIRADIAPNGTWVLGTTGGDPETPDDDDKNLLYGFVPGSGSSIGSSYTTVRIKGPGADITDTVHLADAPQTQVGNQVRTVWAFTQPHRVTVTQTLQIAANPFSGRSDVVAAHYVAANDDRMPLDIGVRALLDIKIGKIDGAPYFIPGLGAVNREREFVGADVPAYWLAFESPVYDPNSLRGMGILRGRDMTAPDRFIIAWWRRLHRERWDYAVDVTRSITQDSAVALYWNPQPVPPGGQREMQTAYGLTARRGGSAFVSAPVQAHCGDTIAVAIFVNNFDVAPLTGGLATLRLPAGLSLAAGEITAKPIATIPGGGTGSATWSVRVDPRALGLHAVSVTARFDGGREFTAAADVTVDCVPTPDTPTATPTSTPTATRTPSPSPMPTATVEGPPAGACAFILNRVPPAAISDALANPARIRGWMELRNPALPPGPNNPPKTRLSLQNIGVPYHPLYNPLVFKDGCP